MLTISTSSDTFQTDLARFCRGGEVPRALTDSVAQILAAVRDEGDAAVARYAAKFDGANLDPASFRVGNAEIRAAARRLPLSQRQALRAAHRAVVEFNSKALPKDWSARNLHGARVGEKFDPIQRVGLYIPGGQVPLVSSVLMSATLARIAGCPQIAAFTPCGADGKIADGLLAALDLVGVREVYRVGGVHAIGAMAFGTASIPGVDKVFGPGNAYVCEAKRQVFGVVGVDSLPGPSEVMVVADASARPDYAAADLLAQAEHGSGRERIYLVATSKTIVDQVAAQIAVQRVSLSREAKMQKVLEEGFLAIVAPRPAQIAQVANFVAPEHLELLVKPALARQLVPRIATAGAIMVGNDTPTALGDFAAGPSHVLPTGRAGRFFSGLRVADFMRRTSVLSYDAKSVRRAEPVVAAFAAMERLDAHGRSAAIRCRKS